MTTRMPAAAKKPAPNKPSQPSRPARPETEAETRPAMPDRHLWETDREKAFEAGVRWFLAVSQAA